MDDLQSGRPSFYDPFILSGLRQGLGRAIVGVMVGELYAATAGIGFMITVAGATFQTDKGLRRRPCFRVDRDDRY